MVVYIFPISLFVFYISRKVGAGTAGSILANRLSLKHSVLLLEAGGPMPFTVHVPAFASYMYDEPGVTNTYTSIPQVNILNRVRTHKLKNFI